MFPRLIRSHCKSIAIKVSYVKKYNQQQKKDAKVPYKYFWSFWSSSLLLILADRYGESC